MHSALLLTALTATAASPAFNPVLPEAHLPSASSKQASKQKIENVCL